MTVSIQQPEFREFPPRPHRFTAEEYLQLSRQGYLTGKKTEFIDGEIIDVASQLNDHA